jgi:hypothetical protein
VSHANAIELSPPYIDVTLRRWQDFTGATAVLDGDGRTFDQIAAERPPQAASAARFSPQGVLASGRNKRNLWPSSWRVPATKRSRCLK